MKKLIITIVLCFHFSPTFSETVIRNEGEDNNEFVNRILPKGSQIAHPVIATTEWKFSAPAIIAFYNYLPPNQDISDGENVIGVLLVPLSKNKYERIEIDTYGPEARTAEIESVFFAKIGKSTEKKLFVLVAWYPNPGSLYRTFVYEKPSLSLPARLKFLEQIALDVDGGCIYCRKEATTAAKVKMKLRELDAKHP